MLSQMTSWTRSSEVCLFIAIVNTLNLLYPVAVQTGSLTSFVAIVDLIVFLTDVSLGRFSLS